MKTVLNKIIDELQLELNEMDIDEYYRLSPIFKWMQKLCKLHLTDEEKQIIQAYITGQNSKKDVTPELYFESTYNK
jgi:hypothetical protein